MSIWQVYDLTTGKQLLSIVFDVRPTSLVVDSAETNVYVGTSDGSIKTLSLLDPPRSLTQHFDDKKESSFIGHKKSINCLALSTDETTLVSGSADETIKLWYISNKQCVRTIRMRGSITSIIVRTLSKKFNTSQFQPKCVLKSFQKRYDDNPREMMELYAPQDMEFESSTSEDKQESETSALKAKVDELKRINQELFIFAKNNILEQNESEERHRESTKMESSIKVDSGISDFTKIKKRRKNGRNIRV